MLGLPTVLADLIHRLTRLPGVGPKAAERMALAVLKWDSSEVAALGHALSDAVAHVTACPRCGCLSQDEELCSVCSAADRDRRVVCVVEDALDAVALERGGTYHGGYHVLGGALSPIQGVLPEDLRITELLERIAAEGIREVIVATNASPDGEATALYLKQELAEITTADGAPIKLTRLARGLPSGSQLDYADAATLQSALDNRTEL